MDRAVATLQQHVQILCLTDGWVLLGGDRRRVGLLFLKHLKKKSPWNIHPNQAFELPSDRGVARNRSLSLLPACVNADPDTKRIKLCFFPHLLTIRRSQRHSFYSC